MQAKGFEPPYFHGSVMEVYICKFISNLRKPLFSMNVFYFQSYPFRDLILHMENFTWVCWTASLIFYTSLQQHSAFFCTLILVLFPKHCFKNRNILSQTWQVFFLCFKWFLKFYLMHRMLLFDQRSRYGFFLLLKIDNRKPIYSPDFLIHLFNEFV